MSLETNEQLTEKEEKKNVDDFFTLISSSLMIVFLPWVEFYSYDSTCRKVAIEYKCFIIMIVQK